MKKEFGLHWIKNKILTKEYECSSHAEEERESEKITLDDIEQSIINGEILEHYPDDQRGECCLLLGYNKEGYPTHIVCGRTISDKLRIITVYIPSLPKWLDEKTRRR